ncbi:hypothetical protein SFRURICE_015221 [Spodoptera frugiperda]|uniref:SFRICE_024905 n=1 Tax=Spodoptera frugiperda TaxID=7108 RepID=A0A2H1W492_SPOFR|nr:hypothetical protein SFRURICE_015221 [Spodoptera frugiperda]
MVTSWRALALLAALHACAALPEPVYHDQFAVHVPAGPHHVDDIARRHGFVNHGQVAFGNSHNFTPPVRHSFNLNARTKSMKLLDVCLNFCLV